MENYNLQKNTMRSESIAGKRKPRSVSSFLKKTYEILEGSQNYYIVKWAHDGVGFIVMREEEFSKQILPRYFKHANYSSFVRQLNMYNFHKIREANNQSYFHHQYFRRDDKELLSQIRRKPEKKKRKNEDSEEEDLKSQASMKHNMRQSEQELGSEARSGKQPEKKRKAENTHCVFVSEKDEAVSKVSLHNILLSENDDDKVSINNELGDRFPCYPTKEIFCPSSNNIYPFPFRAPISQFNLFF